MASEPSDLRIYSGTFQKIIIIFGAIIYLFLHLLRSLRRFSPTSDLRKMLFLPQNGIINPFLAIKLGQYSSSSTKLNDPNSITQTQ